MIGAIQLLNGAKPKLAMLPINKERAISFNLDKLAPAQRKK